MSDFHTKIDPPCIGQTEALYSVYDDVQQQAAATLCPPCPKREQCLQGAVRRREKFGVWGGLTQTELRARHRLERLG